MRNTLTILFLLLISNQLLATNYTESDKATLQTRMGITIKIVAITANKQTMPVNQFLKGIYQIRLINVNQLITQQTITIQ